jgi:hypothetical protein
MALTRLGPNQAVNLSSNTTGTLGVANGGTGLTSGTTDQFLKFTGSTTVASAAVSESFGYWSTTGYRATLNSGNVTFSDATVTTMSFSNETYDNGSNYNTGTYKYVVPTTGRYFFTFNISIEAGVDNEGKQWFAGLYKNSEADPKLRVRYNGNNGRWRAMGLSNSGTLSLSASDEMHMKVYCDRSDNNDPYWQGGNIPWASYIEGWRIS